jgi:CRISPR/Cas system CMR subunit Cmr4 (Cas7 group RAMP superfamily)
MIYLARFIIETLTPLHCGGGDDEQLDHPVDRDAFGLYRLPGSSLAGVARAQATKWYPPSADGQEPREVSQAFGYAEPGRNAGQASSIWFRDGRLLDFSGSLADDRFWRTRVVPFPMGPYLRDHSRIDFETGAGENGGKFDEEFAPAGLRFVLEILLDGWNQEPAAETLAIFRRLGWSVQRGELTWGGKSAKGFGRFKTIEAQCRRFDLTQKKGVLAWLNLSPGPLFQPGEGEEISFERPPQQREAGLNGRLDFPMRALGPILVGGSPSHSSSAIADVAFYQEPFFDYARQSVQWGSVLPGSTIRGVVRHRVYQIVATLFSDSRAKELVSSIFGQMAGEKPRRGKIFFEDVRFPPTTEKNIPHVAIDRFSGGSLKTALFFEAPLWDKDLKFKVKIHFENLTDLEVTVLAQAFWDLLEGKLPLGAGDSRGNGFIGLAGGSNPLAFETIGGEIRWAGETLSAARPELANAWLAKLDLALNDYLKRSA